MTPNQRIFADEYIKTRNATRAYLKAYPKTKNANSARVLASKLLTNVNIAEYIDDALNKLHNHTIADAAEIMQYFTSVMRGEVGEEQLSVTGEVVAIKSKTSDRTAAAEKLARMLGVDKDIERKRAELEREKFELEKRQRGDGDGDSAPKIIFAEDGGVYAE